MKFGTFPVEDCVGGILAHSISIGGKRMRKGRRLSYEDVDSLRAAEISEIVVALLESGDLGEDEAAERIAAKLCGGGNRLITSAPFTGRVNIYVEEPGILYVDERRVLELNRIDPAITLATLPNFSRLAPRMLAATVKIITYGVPEAEVVRAETVGAGALKHRDVAHRSAGLIMTEIPGGKHSLIEKGRVSVESRLSALGISLVDAQVTSHDAASIGKALKDCDGSILLILTGSATSDSRDVAPYGLQLAGGVLHRFGMPVDPGNLLFLGKMGPKPVIGLPGCARSPALNGADWVLERVACGIAIEDIDIAAMGAGGLLKEIPVRPQPRGTIAAASARPIIEALVIEAGNFEQAFEIAKKVSRSRLDRVKLVGSEPTGDLAGEIAGSNVALVRTGTNLRRRGDSIRMGIAALGRDADAVVLIPADGFVPNGAQLNRMAAAFSPSDNREIIRFAGPGISSGPPILFGRRFFESLSELGGTSGASKLIAEFGDFLNEIDP